MSIAHPDIKVIHTFVIKTLAFNVAIVYNIIKSDIIKLLLSYIMTKLEKGFKNDYMSVMFYPKREYQKPYIIVRDLTDLYNEPTAYTRKVRGIERAWSFIEQIMNNYELQDDIKMNDITKILDEKFNLDTHQYCAVD